MSESEEKETGRLEAFSDGVFAIAITLLILEIKVPEIHDSADNSSLLKELLHLWPSYLAFFISFFTILILWVNHHRVFVYIKRVDSIFLFINGFLLMIVSFIPFPTALLAEHFQYQHRTTATAFYTGTYVLIAVAFNILWHYAIYRRRLVGRSASQEGIDRITKSYMFGPPLYLVTFLLSFCNVVFSLVFFTALAFFYALIMELRPARR